MRSRIGYKQPEISIERHQVGGFVIELSQMKIGFIIILVVIQL